MAGYIPWDPAPLHVAGVRPTHLVELLGGKISRVTASNWMWRRTQPHSMVRRDADIILEAVKRAIETGTLPAAPDSSYQERWNRTLSAIRAEVDAALDGK
jgi:hypothetical protein